MKTGNYRNIISLILFSTLIFTSCKKSTVQAPPKVIPDASVVNKFIWNGLNNYYLWTIQVPNLSDPKYTVKDTLNQMLNKFTDPQALFTSLLYQYNTIDKWSFLVDNSQTITNWISGTSKTMGYDFMLAQYGSSGYVFGFVRYIYKGSPAEAAGMKRGDIFTTVNNQQLTTTNYETLLFSTDSYTLGFANIINKTVIPNTRTVTMTDVVMQEDPINKDTIFVYDNKKIGYLVYNGFNSDYDIPLNNVIQSFKDANIDEMVLDLRYNGGGSVQSSIYLSSMLYSTDATKLFAHAQYNNNLQAYLVEQNGAGYLNSYFVQAYLVEQNGAGYLNSYFVPTIDATATTASTPISTLNLQKIYIIVSDNTASASELLINGLRPYLNVKVVGINTVGKYVGSTTIQDWDSNGNVNTNDPYAMQPIVVKYSNSLGVTDFVNGLTPDIVAQEDITNLLPFGDPNETLLAAVLADIKGMPVTSMTLKSAQMGLKKVADSHQFKPYANDMYINPQKINRSLKK